MGLGLLLAPIIADPSAPPMIGAKSAILIDEVSGKVLYSKEPDMRCYPASTTKVMTAMLLLERCRPEEKIKVPKKLEFIDGASLNLKPGEVFTATNLIRGILWRSANDACEVAATHVAGSVTKFVDLMNSRAKAIGCTNTTFTNPHGLPDEKHMTTVRDLSLIARQAMKDPEFRAIVAQRKGKISRSINQADTTIISKNKVLDLDPTADGIKTGYTRAARGCYIGSASRNGSRFISVILGSEDSLGEHMALMDWGHAVFQSRVLKQDEYSDYRGEVHQGNGPVRAGIARDTRVVMGPDVQASTSFYELTAPVSKGMVVGELVLTDAAGTEERLPLVAHESVPLRESSLSTMGLAGFAMLSLLAMRRKRIRMTRAWEA